MVSNRILFKIDQITQSSNLWYEGIYLVLVGISLHFLLRHRRNRPRQYFFIGYLLAIFILSSINFGFLTKYNDDLFIERGIREDSFQDFRVEQFSSNEDICLVIIVWLADALLVCLTVKRHSYLA